MDRSADKKLGLSLWGGFACHSASPGGSSEAAPLEEVGVGAGRTGSVSGAGVPALLSGVANVAGNAHLVGSWVPINFHL